MTYVPCTNMELVPAILLFLVAYLVAILLFLVTSHTPIPKWPALLTLTKANTSLPQESHFFRIVLVAVRTRKKVVHLFDLKPMPGKAQLDSITSYGRREKADPYTYLTFFVNWNINSYSSFSLLPSLLTSYPQPIPYTSFLSSLRHPLIPITCDLLPYWT